MENPIKMDDLGVPLFLETPILGNTQKVFFNEYLKLCLWRMKGASARWRSTPPPIPTGETPPGGNQPGLPNKRSEGIMVTNPLVRLAIGGIGGIGYP